MRKLTFALLCSLLSAQVFGYDFKDEDSGLCFNITSNTEPYTVEITYVNDDSRIQNNYLKMAKATVPETVTYNGKTYSVTGIGKSAFNSCHYLTSVSIPNSVTSIGDFAFAGCSSLITLTIPKSVTNIGEQAFVYCNGLVSINVENGNEYFSSDNGVLYNAEKTKLLFCLIGKKGDFIIPNSITDIEICAFYNCSDLTSVTIPSSVTSIGASAFNNCSGLTSVFIPNSVTEIGWNAFAGSNKLLTIYCEASSKPNGWEDKWNPYDRPVVWGSTGPSAISDNEANAVSIYATNNTIVVENATADIYVYDTMGRLVARKGVCEGSAQIAMPRGGIYIVKCGAEVKRIYLGFRN